jgi:uncharacterized protein (UPF0303 family)
MDSDTIDRAIEEREAEERELQFATFSNADGLALGNRIVAAASERDLRVSVDIERHGVVLFHHAMEGMSADNEEWLERKKRVVNRFGKSSFHIRLLLESSGRTIEERYLLDPRVYAPHGGAFPIIVRGSGLIGTIAVSGLKQEDDHALVVAALRAFLRSA